MSMMKAELTAENSPAYKTTKFVKRSAKKATHKYESGIEILAVLLDIFDIVLARFLVISRVEVNQRIIGL